MNLLRGDQVSGRPDVGRFLPSFIQQVFSLPCESGSTLGATKDTSRRGSALRNLKA